MEAIIYHCFGYLSKCIEWFVQLLNATGLTEFYLGYVFVAMATGFLLKRFGSALSLGSDQAAQHFKRKGDK